jgi:hypothetical protein
MKHNNGDKDKKGKMSDWKATKKVKQPDGSYKISYVRSAPGDVGGKVKGGSIAETYKKVDKKRFPTIDSYRKYVREYNMPKTEAKEEVIRPLKKVATRGVKLQPPTSKRKLSTMKTPPPPSTPPPSTPPRKKSKPIYAKTEKAPDRTWTSGKKGLKGLVAATTGTLAGKKVVKDRTGVHVGTKVKQSTTRPVSEKRAGEKGVVEAQLGSERQKQGQKRTASGLATAKTGKGKKMNYRVQKGRY